MFSAESLFSSWKLPKIATGLDLTCKCCKVHDSLNNKVLLSNNRQKQALFDEFIIAQIPGKYYSLDTACHSSFGLMATLYPTRNISWYLCDNIYLQIIIMHDK